MSICIQRIEEAMKIGFRQCLKRLQIINVSKMVEDLQSANHPKCTIIVQAEKIIIFDSNIAYVDVYEEMDDDELSELIRIHSKYCLAASSIF